MSQKKNPKLTITLTNRRPVTIVKADWPIIATHELHQPTYTDLDMPGETLSASRTLTVRQHADGRALVYVSFVSWQWRDAKRVLEIREGQLVSGDNIVSAITITTSSISSSIVNAPRVFISVSTEYTKWEKLAKVVINQLPPEELT